MIPRRDRFLFDVDGTLVLADDPSAGGGVHPLNGACEVLRTLRSRGARLAVFTNGTGQTPRAAAGMLRAAGLDIADAEMLTPAVVAAEHIRTTYPGEGVLAFGPEGFVEPLIDAEIRLLGLQDAGRARVVLVGADPDFTYQKLLAGCGAAWLSPGGWGAVRASRGQKATRVIRCPPAGGGARHDDGAHSDITTASFTAAVGRRGTCSRCVAFSRLRSGGPTARGSD